MYHDVQVIHQGVHKARKTYECGLAEFFGDVEFPRGMKFSEIRQLVVYRRSRKKILKGDTYIRQFNIYEGDTYTWRANKAIFDIFCKYDLL